MITLCEDCFPDSAAREVLSIVPLSPCVSCGRYDMGHKQGLRCHRFRSDPRPVESPTAPRITMTAIEDNIAEEYGFTAFKGAGNHAGTVNPALKLITFVVLVLRNGSTVTGESAWPSPENFDPDLCRKIARAIAVQKIWPLIGGNEAG